MVEQRTIAAGMLVVGIGGCFNASAYTPILSDVRGTNTFDSVPTGATTAAVEGRFFAPGITVHWNGKAVPTTYKSDRLVEIALGTEQNALAGKAVLTAGNDGGMISQPLKITVYDAPLTLGSINPSSAATGSNALTLQLTGTGFTPTSQVLWNDTALATDFTSSTQLSASVPASLLASPGQGLVQVQNEQCSQFAFPCINPTPAVAFLVGGQTVTSVPFLADDMAWDGTHGILFVTSTLIETGPATLAALDPVKATLGATTTLPAGPLQLSVSAGDLYLYTAALKGVSTATRFSLPGLTGATQIRSSNGDVSGIAAAPDAPETTAILWYGGFGALGVVDGTTMRSVPFVLGPPTSFAWGFDATGVFAIDSLSAALLRFPVTPTAMLPPTTLGSEHFLGSHLYYDRASRLLYDERGVVLDEQGAAQTPIDLPAGCREPLIDGTAGRIFMACAESDGLTLRSFDLVSRQPLSRVLLEPPDYRYLPPRVSGARRLVRWGPNGLAAAGASKIYLYSGPFVR